MIFSLSGERVDGRVTGRNAAAARGKPGGGMQSRASRQPLSGPVMAR